MEEDNTEEEGQATKRTDSSRRLFRILGYSFISVAVLAAIYGTIFLVAWDRGQVQKAQEEETALENELANQMNLAREEVTTGKYTLASRRLEWILERDQDFPGAEQLLAEIQSLLNAPATPTAIPRVTNTPNSELLGDPETEPAAELAAIALLMDQTEWDQAITAIIAFQAKHPDYQRQESDRMLYNAYLNLGQVLVMGEQVELGLFYFDQAEKLGDLPIEAEDQRTWAELYLLGISYYGIDWDTTLFYFRGLCAAAPFFQDACSKLHDSLILFGDQYQANNDYCPAESLYVEASQIDSNSELLEKIQTAREFCLEATPTATITPGVPISGTATIDGVVPATEIPGN